MAYDRAGKSSHELLPAWDRNADAYFFAPDGGAIYIQTTDAARDKLYRAALSGAPLKASAPTLVVGDHNNMAFALSHDGRTLVWTRDATEHPAEIWTAPVAPAAPFAARALTHENDGLVAQLAINPAEDFWFAGAGGTRVQGFVIKPP